LTVVALLWRPRLLLLLLAVQAVPSWWRRGEPYLFLS
jgi:hypothetical protein